ncbi:isochorismatase family protein [Bradyrhizobium sp. LMTR 3]|uniref:isochorismatase family protein n=1 Tax=Bradyrhizobium sp. LMTR 3 TaxID=189873 RepID=UPI000810A07F|nr:isochorismatase family protein [Bradyrhizobium sp. LMTR 3]OCK58378.1 hypothetical protein LMTR3_21460 [Bradyrhizobium sp. LMTR 3]
MATNMTVRGAFERGHREVMVEDLMATVSPEAHAMSFKSIFPLGRVRARGPGRAMRKVALEMQ